MCSARRWFIRAAMATPLSPSWIGFTETSYGSASVRIHPQNSERHHARVEARAPTSVLNLMKARLPSRGRRGDHMEHAPNIDLAAEGETHCDSDLLDYMWEHDDEPIRDRERARVAIAKQETMPVAVAGASEKCSHRWQQARLRRELAYFWNRYWLGRTLDYEISDAFFKKETRASASCYATARQILIDLTQHRSDRSVRSSLLHELCHAAAGPRSRGHDIYFFREVERLLAAGAPIRIDFLYYEHGQDVDPDMLDMLPRCDEMRRRQ